MILETEKREKLKLLEGIAEKLYSYIINTEEIINYTYDLEADHFTEKKPVVEF